MNINEIYNIDTNNSVRLSELASAYTKNKVAPFIGGGMSIPLYPSWGELLTRLLNMSCNDPKIISEFNYYKLTDYEKAAEFVYNISEAFIMKNINDIFDINLLSNKEIPSKLLYLAATFDGSILTTNYDRCLEQAYELIKKTFRSHL